MTKDDAQSTSRFHCCARGAGETRSAPIQMIAGALCVLGLIDAALGRKEEALREGRRAVELLPVEKDAINGTRMIMYLAMIAAWVGEKDLACEQLATCHPLPERSQLWRIETAAVLGPAARRPVLRKNRRLPRAEI